MQDGKKGVKNMKPLKKLQDNLKDKLQNNDFLKDDNDEEEKDKKRIIIYIIIIIILLLLLITSCTSGFFGKLGNLFRNEGNYTIDKDTNQKEEVLNQNLQFESNYYEMSVTDSNLKIGFTYNSIAPESFTCVTSDASIATCYVSDGYVVLNPKGVGDISVYLQTTTNGKIYKASTKVSIGDATREIELEQTSGTIYLGSNKSKSIPFSLKGLSGEVSASSSNSSVATASIVDGVLVVKGVKSGTATITVSLTYNGQVYTAEYEVKVVDGKNPNAVSKPTSTGSSTNPSSPGSSGSSGNTTTPGNPSGPGGEKPTDPSQPSTPDVPKEVKRSIQILHWPSTCFLENDELCIIKYQVVETIDGKNPTVVQEDISNIIVGLDNENITKTMLPINEEGIGEIILKPNSSMTPTNVVVTLGLKDNNDSVINKTINFKNHDGYELKTDRDNYTMALSVDKDGNNVGTKTIILNSHDRALFTGEIAWTYVDNVLTILDKDNPSTRIVVSVDDPANALTYLGVIYDSVTDGSGPTSLPIEIKANKTGEIYFTAKGYVNGVEIDSVATFKLTITQKYIVNLYSNGGYFDILNKDDETSTVRTYSLELGDVLGLSNIEPFMSADSTNCTYYAFIGYDENKNSTTASITGDYTITENTKPITNLYAIYDQSSAIETPDDKVYKTFWIFDPDLFSNKEANDQTLIYPGAKGEYKINLYNDTGVDIQIVGFTLAEDTVCVNEGCLNMGYILKYDGFHYLGNNVQATCGSDNKQYCNSNYFLLNQGNKTTRNTKEINFIEEGYPIITIKAKSSETINFAEVWLNWKWVDINNALDTAIGKKAATTDEENVNDIYGFSLGIHYKNVTDSCSLD